MKRHLTIAALFVLGLSTPAVAQIPLDLAPGSRIRVVDDRGLKTVGTLILATPDSLVVNTDDDTQRRAFDVSSVSALQVSQGRYHQVAKTTLISMGALGIVLGAISAASYEPCHPQGWFDCMLAPESRGSAFAWGFAGGAALGLPLGLIVGFSAKYDRWADVSLSGHRPSGAVAQVSRRPGGRIGVGLSIPLGR